MQEPTKDSKAPEPQNSAPEAVSERPAEPQPPKPDRSVEAPKWVQFMGSEIDLDDDKIEGKDKTA